MASDGADGWCVVMSNQMAEDEAQRSIERAGYTTYLPQFRRRLSGVRIDAAGRRIRSRHDGLIVLRPLFRSYLLVARDPNRDTHAISTANGVARVLRHGNGDPQILSDKIVVAIRAACEAGDFDEVARKRPDLRIGDRVQVRAGDLGGLIGTLQFISDNDRCVLLLDMLGRDNVRARIHANQLQRVAATG